MNNRVAVTGMGVVSPIGDNIQDFWENLNSTDLDSTQVIDMQDSLLQLSIDFSSDAQMTSFEEAIDEYSISKIDTIKI